MSTEKKITEKENIATTANVSDEAETLNTAIMQTPVTEEETTATEVKTKKPVFLVIRREKYPGKEKGTFFFGYYVTGLILGKKVKAVLRSPDIHGYEMLDLFFATYGRAALVSVPYISKNESTGQIRRGFTYEAQVGDGDGDIVRIKLLPAKDTDRAIIEYLFRKAERENTNGIEKPD